MITEVTVKEVWEYNTVSLTATFDKEPTDKEILELRARARRLVTTQLVKKEEA